MKIIYRTSDAGYKKIKPDYVNNELCLKNAIDKFPLSECEWVVIADNVSDSTSAIIQKYVPKDNIKYVSVGHGAGTFNLALDIALTYNDDECVYFLESPEE